MSGGIVIIDMASSK